MNVLFINHCFEQDIDSLVRAMPSARCWVISVQHWGTPARRFFPESVFGSLHGYWAPELEGARRRWAREAARLLWDAYRAVRFDVIVAPSDSFFYLFDVVKEARRMGIPFFVAQKETTITDHSLDVHAKATRQWAPFTADFMTVCSARHKRFWINAGCDPSLVEVTGQPRFDFYAQATPSVSTDGRRRVLFLTYDLNAYSESAQGTVTSAEQPWARLRSATMERLSDEVRAGRISLEVKPHPQQDRADVAAIRAELAALAAEVPDAMVRLAEPAEDTRTLIREADVVVGFQTTALFEAVVAGKVVVYTGWGDQFHRQRDILIPFHEWGDFIHVATSPDDLTAALRAVPGARSGSWQAAYEEYLGPADGKASERTWKAVTRVCAEHAARTAEREPYRRRVVALAERAARRERWRGRVEGAVLGLAARVAPGRIGARLARWRDHWRARLAELEAPPAPRGPASPAQLGGRHFASLGDVLVRVGRSRLGAW